MSLSDVIAEHDARLRAQVMADTWGHLDVDAGTTHAGRMVFTEDRYGMRSVLFAEFSDGAGQGPWFYEAVHEWLLDQQIAPGCIYRFVGSYSRDADGGDHFDGTVSLVASASALAASGEEQP